MNTRRTTPLLLLLIVIAAGGCAAQPEPAAGPAAVERQVAGTARTATPSAGGAPGPTVEPSPYPTATLAPTPLPTPPPVESLPEMSLNVELFYGERWMRVHQRVELTNPTRDTWQEVVFNVPLHYNQGAFLLDAVDAAIGEAHATELPGYENVTTLRVPLPEPAEPGDDIRIEFRYRVLIPPIEKTSWPPNGTTGWTPELIQAGEWYPSLVPYVEGEGWQTWLYYPIGDPTAYPLVNASLTVWAEPGIVIASGGPIPGLGGYPGLDVNGAWHFRVERARGVAFYASPDYEVLIDEQNPVPLFSYHLADHPEAGQAALDIARESIDLFERLYGPYPYRSLAVVENGFFGGMEYTEMVSVTDYAYATYDGEAPSILHALVAHETAHQWWYGAVGNHQAREPWLDESIAFYSEALYVEAYYPDGLDWWWRARVDQYHPEGPVNADPRDYANSSTFIVYSYGQAARFMRALRELIGDEAFFAFLQDYYTLHRWQMVTAEDFFGTLREHTDEDYSGLVETYFDGLDETVLRGN